MDKGQLVSGDFVASVFIFLILFSVIIIAWDSRVESYTRRLQLKEMETAAAETADKILTPGKPSGWENSNASIIGLVDRDRRVDPRKLNAFISMDYNQSKVAMGISSYDYFFNMPKSNMTKGFLGGEMRAFVRRAVIYNGADYIELTLWK